MSQVRAVRFNTVSEGMHSSGKGDPPEGPHYSIPVEAVHLSVNQGWQACLETLQGALPAQTIQTWFFPIKPVSFVDNILFLRVQSKFIANWLSSNYMVILQEAVHVTFGKDARVEFIVENPENDPPPASPDPSPERAEVADPAPVEKEEKTAPDTARSIASYLDDRFRLDNFFAGSGNRFAIKAVEHVGNHPGKSPYNPLVLHGGTGTGKTHLLHALGNAVSQNARHRRQIYMTSEIFLHQYIVALQSQKIPRFVNLLRSLDVFLLDDLQFLSGKIKSQEMLLLVLRELIKRGSQVAIALNVPPNQLSRFNSSLVAFLQGGLIVDVHESDRLTREQIVRHHLSAHGVFLEEKAIQFLAEKMQTNIHHLQSVIVRIVAQVSLLQKELSYDDVRYIVAQTCPQSEEENAPRLRREVSITDIVNATAKYFDLPVDVVQGVSRKQKIATARQVAIYLCRELTEESLSSIGFHFSNLHHASVIYAHNRIREKLPKTPRLRTAVEKIRALLA